MPAISFVQAASNQGTSNVTVTLPSNPTQGNYLVAFGNGPGTIAGWTRVGTLFPNTHYRIVGASESPSYGFSQSGVTFAVHIREFSGVGAVFAAWATVSASNTTVITSNASGATNVPINALLTSASDVAFTGSAAANGTFNNSITSDYRYSNMGGGSGLISAYDIKSSIGTYNVTYTTTRNAYLGLSVVALQAANDITPRTQTGKAAILKTISQTQTGKSRISLVTARIQQGLARITQVVSKLQTGIAHITNIVNRTQSGKAAIRVTVQRTQSGVSKVVFTRQKLQTGKANIATQVNRTQTGKARMIRGVDTGAKPEITIIPDNIVLR